jgi:hypothetical protein
MVVNSQVMKRSKGSRTSGGSVAVTSET